MKELYFDRTEFEAKGHFQMDKEGLTPIMHPELFLSHTLKTSFYPAAFSDNIPSKVRVFCGMLLTDKLHDGIWLAIDDRIGKLTIPGGFICDTEWNTTLEGNPWRIIHKTFLRSLKDLHPYLRDDIDPMLQEIDSVVQGNNQYLGDILQYLISKYGLKFRIDDATSNSPFFYLYRGNCGMDSGFVKDFFIFQMLEVDKPETRVGSLMNYIYNDRLVWYGRKDHYYNIREHGDRRKIFDTYNEDIRITENGLSILDGIFRTERVFGKLSIY